MTAAISKTSTNGPNVRGAASPDRRNPASKTSSVEGKVCQRAALVARKPVASAEPNLIRARRPNGHELDRSSIGITAREVERPQLRSIPMQRPWCKADKPDVAGAGSADVADHVCGRKRDLTRNAVMQM